MYATIKAKIDNRQPLTRPEWLALTQKARALAAVAPHSASRRFYLILQCAALRTISREGFARDYDHPAVGLGATSGGVDMSDQIKYCYSGDEERFSAAESTTREGAAEEARYELLNDCGPGEVTTVWVGVRHNAASLLASRHESIGQRVCETMDEWLSDDIAWDEPICVLPKEAQAELGRLVVSFVSQRGGFRAFAAREITAHEVTAPEDEPGN